MERFKQKLRSIATGLDAINEWTGKIIAWFTLLMVLITFAVVVLRYVFNIGWIAMQESVIYLHAIVFMLGSAYTLKHNQHVRVDIFYQKFSPSRKAWVDLCGTLFFLIPVYVFIFWMSFDYVQAAWRIQESSREAGGLPGVYLLKSTILVMASLLLLQGCSLLITSLLQILTPAPKPTTTH